MQPTITSEQIADELVANLEVAYTTLEPVTRRNAIAQIELIQQCGIAGMSHLQLASAALSILQRPDVSLATRAYGATILRQLMNNPKYALSAEESHFMDIVAWIVGADDADDCYAGRMGSPISATGPVAASSIHRVVISSCSQLVGTAASLSWPQSAPQLIEALVGADGSLLANRRNTQRVLLEICRACCEPAFNTLPKARIGPLRQAIKAASPAIIRAAISALSRQYTYLLQITTTPNGVTAAASSAQEANAVQCVCEDLGICMEVLSLAARTCDPMIETLWNAGVDDALGALVIFDVRANVANSGVSAANFSAGALEALVSTAGCVPLLALDACVAIINNISRDALFPKDIHTRPQQAEVIRRLASFCTNVLSTMGAFVAKREYDAVSRLVEISSRSPSLKLILLAAAELGFSAPLSSALFASSITALQLPSVLLATDICEAISDRLQSVLEDKSGNPSSQQQHLAGFEADRCLLQLAQLSVRDHFNAWTPLIARHSQQDCDYQKEGRKLSELACDNSDAFMASYSQLRSAMAPLCAAIAALYPSTAEQFVVHLVGKLRPPVPQDSKTSTGNVTQRSATYATWDSVEYLVGCALAPTVFSILSSTSQTVSNWLSSLLATLREVYNTTFSTDTSDATLAPVFMNLLQHVWSVCLPSNEFMFVAIPKRVQGTISFRQLLTNSATLQVANEAIVYLFAFMRKVPSSGHIMGDPDLVSARKRGMTLLIRFCSTFVPGLCVMDLATGRSVAKLIRSEAERSLVADKVLHSERSLLNEALAGLTNIMSAEDAEASTKALLGPSVETLRAIGGTMSAESLAFLLCDDSRTSYSQRESLRDSVSTLTAVLRRSTVSPFTSQVASTIIPLLGNVTLTVHSLKASHLHPDFGGILDPTDDEQKQAMINGSGVRRPPDLTNRVGNTRRYFAALRIALYQGIALLPRFLPVESFTEGITQVLKGSEFFSTPTMRDLCEQCLFPVTTECPALIAVTLNAIIMFLYNRANVQSTEKQQIVDQKQLMYFTKDIAVYVRASLVEGKKYQDIQKGPPVEGPSFQSNATTLVASSSATCPFATDAAALNLLVASVCALLTWGGDVRSAAYLAMITINELLKRDPAMGSYADACLTLFSVACASTITNSTMDRQSTRDYLLSMLSDIYVNHYPSFSAALILENDHTARALRGIRSSIASAAEIEGLHSHLMSVKGPRQKRQAFVDFTVKCLINQGAAAL